MALDGSWGDHFVGRNARRRIRLITFEYALSVVPKVVILLKQQKLTIGTGGVIGGFKTRTLYENLKPENFWVFLEEDFQIIKEIALQSRINLSSSTGTVGLKNQVIALVRERFADRGVPNG